MSLTTPAPEIASPSLQDGFNGARDARLLDTYADDGAFRSVVHVQCTDRTRDLLKRAGIKRGRAGHFYSVAVMKDRFGRLQLKPANNGGAL